MPRPIRFLAVLALASFCTPALARRGKATSDDALLRQIESERGYPVRVLEAVRAAIPDDVSLATLALDGESLKLTGYAPSNEQIAIFLEAMDKSPFLEDVYLVSIDVVPTGESAESVDAEGNSILREGADRRKTWQIIATAPRYACASAVGGEALVPEEEIADTYSAVSLLARTGGLMVSKFLPLSQVDGGGMARAPVDMVVQGSWNGIVSVLAGLAQAEHAVGIRTLSVARSVDSDLLQAEMEFGVYLASSADGEPLLVVGEPLEAACAAVAPQRAREDLWDRGVDPEVLLTFYELREFELTAIQPPTATVRVTADEELTLEVGTPVGRNEGKVSAITACEVRIDEPSGYTVWVLPGCE